MLPREHLLDVDLRDIVQEQGRWLQFKERFLCLSPAMAARRVFLALGLVSVTNLDLARLLDGDTAVRFSRGHGCGGG